MKVIYLVHQFYPEFYTGTENFVLGLAKVTQQMGHRVKVITYSFRDQSFFDQRHGKLLSQETTYQGVPVLYLQMENPLPDMHYALSNEAMTELARRVLVEERPDVLHVAHSMRLAEFIKSAWALKIPYIVTLTDFFLLCPKANLMTSQNSLCSGPQKGAACRDFCAELKPRMIRSRLGRSSEILQNAGCIVAPSKFLAAIFKNEFPDLRFKLIKYGMNYGHLKKNLKHYDANSHLTFFYGGSLIYHKGVHILVSAFKEVKGAAKLKIYGSGDLGDYLRKLAVGDDRIEFCGVFSHTELGEILGKVDVAIVPSIWYENTPIVLLEALTANIPGIVSDLGGMTEIVQDGVNGWSFPTCDNEKLRDIIESLIAAPQVLNEIKSNIKSQHIPSVEQIALAYHREYQELLHSKRGR